MSVNIYCQQSVYIKQRLSKTFFTPFWPFFYHWSESKLCVIFDSDWLSKINPIKVLRKPSNIMKCTISYTNCWPEIFADNFVNCFQGSDIFTDISISIPVSFSNLLKVCLSSLQIFTDNFVNGFYGSDIFTDISVSISVSFSNFTKLSVNIDWQFRKLLLRIWQIYWHFCKYICKFL